MILLPPGQRPPAAAHGHNSLHVIPEKRDEPTADMIGPEVPTAQAISRPGEQAALSRLDALLGEWEMEVSFEAGYFGPGSPPVAGRGSQDQVRVA